MAETTRYHRITPANLKRAIMLVFGQAGSSEREQGSPPTTWSPPTFPVTTPTESA